MPVECMKVESKYLYDNQYIQVLKCEYIVGSWAGWMDYY